MLEIPRHGVINIHPSLLPKYRGASPIATAILNGDTETGTSIIVTATEIDSGPIIAQRSQPISDLDTTESLSFKLSDLSANLLVEILPQWTSGKIKPKAQDKIMAGVII